MSKLAKERRHIEKYFDFEDKVSAVNYYADTMLNKTITMFQYNNLPDSLVEREIELMLQTGGKCIVTEWDGELVALEGNYAPPNDVYYRPTHFIVANPWANINHEFELVNRYLVKTETSGEHKPAVLIRNDPLDRGLLPIIHKYGALLTEVDLTMYLASLNFRAIYAITANTDREFESAKSFLSQVKDGKQGVMLEEEMSNGIKTQPYANSSQGYITQIIELKQYLDGKFLNEIGLNANYNMKRERLSASETDLNEDSLRPLIDTMLEERQLACDEINAQFGTDISVEFASAWEKYNEGYQEELSDEADGSENQDDPIEISSDTNDEEEMTDAADRDTVDESGAVEDDERDEENPGEVTEEDSDIPEEDGETGEESEEEQPTVEVEINIEQAEEVSVEEASEDEEESDEETEEAPEEEPEEESEDESEEEPEEEPEEDDEDDEEEEKDED